MLFQKLRTEFNREARETGREALLLAIAVPVGEERISSGYKIDPRGGQVSSRKINSWICKSFYNINFGYRLN